MLRFLASLLCAAAALAQPLPLSTPEREGISTERLERMHADFETLTRTGARSGASTMIIRNGKIVDWQTFGFRDVEAKLPMQKDTICAIYSMTKPITSVAIMMLVEEGKLSLTDRLDKFAPEFANVRVFEGGTAEEPKLVAPKRPITIRHLLTHTSGLVYPGMTETPAGKLYEKADVFAAPTLEDFISRAASLPLVVHPGEEWRYGISTDVLGYVVQAASGMPFEQFLEKRIFGPLKMNDTYFTVPAAKSSRVAKLYVRRVDKLEPAPARPPRTMPSGGGGLYSTIGDYARFAQMIANGGHLDGVRLLSRKTVELMMENHLNNLARPTTSGTGVDGFGLGGSVRIDIAKANRPGSLGEWGWDGAASTYFRIDPKERLVRVLFMQHFPFDGATHQKFSTLVYQSLSDDITPRTAAAIAHPLPLSTPEREGISTERLKRMHAEFETLTRTGQRAGASTMVIRNGKIVDWQTFGSRDVEGKLPMQKDTICLIYSMTKPITSVAAMILVEEGKLSLTDRLDKFVPEFANVRVFEGGTPEEPKLVAPKRPITIKHLLTHTSGLVYGTMTTSPVAKLYEKVNMFSAPTLKDFIARVSPLPLASHPGEEFRYGISTDVLGYVVQAASDMPFEQFIANRITGPLKMNDTFFEVPSDKKQRVARIYQLRDNKLVALPPRQPGSMPSGGGGMYSTIGDYARFAQMLANGGQLEGVRILSRKTVELMMANHLNTLARPTWSTDEAEGFGLGGAVRIDIAKGSRTGSLGEWGWSGAANTFFRIDPKEKLVYVLFTQHMPHDSAPHQRFATLVHQSLID